MDEPKQPVAPSVEVYEFLLLHLGQAVELDVAVVREGAEMVTYI